MELVVYDLTVDTYYNLLCQDLQKQPGRKRNEDQTG